MFTASFRSLMLNILTIFTSCYLMVQRSSSSCNFQRKYGLIGFYVQRGEVKRLKNSSANSQLIFLLLLLFLHHEYLSMRLPRNNDEVSSGCGWKGKSLLQFLFFFISLQLFLFYISSNFSLRDD